MAGFFGMFDYNKPGKGVSKDEPQKTGPALYFDILLRRFWKLVQLNFIYIICSIPAIVIAWFMSSYAVVWLASMKLDVSKFTENEVTALYLLSACFAIILVGVFGSGSASAGMAYVLRNYVNDTHAWVWSDFKDSMKANFRQGTVIYIIDMIMVMLFTVSFVFYSTAITGIPAMLLRGIIIGMFLVFVMMHMYIYPLLAGFELKIKDIYRNSLALSLAKLPWNAFTLFITGVLGYAMLYFLTISVLGTILIACLIFSLFTFTQMFMINNIIKKFLLEPALEKSGVKEEEVIESVFDDNLKIIEKSNLD